MYGRQRWMNDWRSIKNYRNNIIRKESVADYAELARSRSARPRTTETSQAIHNSEG